MKICLLNMILLQTCYYDFRYLRTIICVLNLTRTTEDQSINPKAREDKFLI